MISLNLRVVQQPFTTIYNYRQLTYNKTARIKGPQAFRVTHGILGLDPVPELAIQTVGGQSIWPTPATTVVL